jgi:3-hydroxyisobutyrate dehydrogenase
MTTIGFIGVGNMGGPMARNLVKAGHSLKVYDLDEEKVNFVVQAGAQAASSIAEAAKGVEVVITMLPAGQHVREVYGADAGVLAAADGGTLLVDCSTIDVESARAVHRQAEEKGFVMLDAPVSGGVAGAEAASLTFMCGGGEAAFTAAKPFLDKMGRNVVHAGPAGNGQVAKICNNMILGTAMIVTGEAFVMAEKLGLEAQKLFDIVSTSSGQTWAMTSYCPVPGPVPTSPANRDYKPGFTVAMMAKDLRLAQAAAQGVKASTPMGAAAAAVYALFESAGNGALDFSGVIKMIQGEASEP